MLHASSYICEPRCRLKRCQSTKDQQTYIFVKDGLVRNTNKQAKPQTVEPKRKGKEYEKRKKKMSPK